MRGVRAGIGVGSHSVLQGNLEVLFPNSVPLFSSFQSAIFKVKHEKNYFFN